MNLSSKKRVWYVLATAIVCVGLAPTLSAQVETKTTTTAGQPTVVTNVERGVVVSVSGNDLLVRMADRSMRHIENVPDSVRVTVDGKRLGVRDLKPGMKLQRTITTTSTPMTVTTVQTVKGKVWFINPPSSIILTMEDNKNQQFKIPEGQKFNVDGQMLDAFAVRKGMIVSATKVVEVPSVTVTKSRSVTGEAAPTPAPSPGTTTVPTPAAEAQVAPPADQPLLIAQGDETPVPAAEAAQEATPPAAAPETTGSSSKTSWVSGLVVLLLLVGVIWWFMSRSKRPKP